MLHFSLSCSIRSLFVVAAVFLLEDNVQAADKTRTLKFAVVLGLTGGASTHANSIKQGVELASEELKKARVEFLRLTPPSPSRASQEGFALVSQLAGERASRC